MRCRRKYCGILPILHKILCYTSVSETAQKKGCAEKLTVKKRVKKWVISLAVLLLLYLLCPLPCMALDHHLKVGFSPFLPPFQFLDKDGNGCGLHLDMLDRISLNYDFSFHYIPYENNLQMLEDLKSGKLDLVLGQASQPRRLDPDLTEGETLSYSQNSMFVHQGKQNAARFRRTFYTSGSVDHMLLSNLNVYSFVSCGDQKEVFQRFQEDPESAMIGIKDSLIYYMEEAPHKADAVVLYNRLESIEFKIILKRSDVGLRRVLHQALNELKTDPDYEKLLYHWLPQNNPDFYRKTISRKFGIAFAVLIILILFYTYFMRQLQNILKRKVAEQTQVIEDSRRKLEKQYSLLADEYDLRNRIVKHSPNAMLVFGRNFLVTMANSSAVELSGFPAIEAGCSVRAIPIFREIVAQNEEKIFEKGFLIDGRELPAGENLYRYSIYQVYRLGEVSGVVLNVQDITRDEKIKQAEFARDKSLSLIRLAAGIAHEIRNPLMAIQTFARLIGEKGDQREVQESFAQYVPSEVDRINKLVESLLNYARPAAIDGSVIKVNDVILNCLTLMHSVLKEKPYTLALHIDDNLYAFANSNKLQQVLINLILNSINSLDSKIAAEPKADPPAFELCAADKGDQVELVLYDEGEGMTPEVLASCRKPFFTTKEIGTGMGLSLCEHYVQEAGGTLELESIETQFTRVRIILNRRNINETPHIDC